MKINDTQEKDLLMLFKARAGLRADLQANHIKIINNGQMVTVYGTVPSYPDKLEVLQMARAENQGSRLIDEVLVKLPEQCRRSDADILAAAHEAIDTITTVCSDSIRITVKDGWLALGGTVRNSYQKETVEYAVSYLVGVTGISNLLLAGSQPILQHLN
jgi:osmotically-inducible protein OsmY